MHVPSYDRNRLSNRIIEFSQCPTVDAESFRHDFVINLPLTDSYSMWESILQIKYEDYELTAERKDVLSQLVDNFIFNISEEFNGMYQPVCIEYEQHSENWLKLRQCRITATKVKSVLSIMSNNGRSRLLNEIVWGHRLIQTAAMKYGCHKEAVAMQEYVRVKSQQVKNFDAKVTGLWVNPKWPLFGCSPDGIVTDPSSNPLVGLLEI